MNVVRYHAASGEILDTFETSTPEIAALQCGTGENWMEGEADPGVHRVMDRDTAPRIEERPALTPFADGPAPHILDMAGLPEGTLVRATNNAGTVVETTDPADPVRLTAPGAYAVQIRPPFPYRDLKQTVEVSDA